MYQDDTCEIISQSDHSFNRYDQKFKSSIYVYHWIRLIRFHIKILAASNTESDYAIRCTWVLSHHLYRWEQWMYNRSSERDPYIKACKNLSGTLMDSLSPGFSLVGFKNSSWKQNSCLAPPSVEKQDGPSLQAQLGLIHNYIFVAVYTPYNYSLWRGRNPWTPISPHTLPQVILIQFLSPLVWRAVESVTLMGSRYRTSGKLQRLFGDLKLQLTVQDWFTSLPHSHAFPISNACLSEKGIAHPKAA